MLLADGSDVARLGERVRKEMTGRAGVLRLPWGASTGWAGGPCDDEDALRALLQRADLAMYDDKFRRRTEVRVPGPRGGALPAVSGGRQREEAARDE